MTSAHQFMIDTHVLLWMLTDPARIPERTRDALADRQNSLFVSAASAWEISTKQRLGKLPHADVVVRAYRHHLDRLGVESLAIADEHSLLAGAMEWAHRDPFDRMVAAQCMSYSLPLVTSDEAFRTLSGVRIVW